MGIDVISITDHDSVNGIERALAAGKKHNVCVIPGVELSSEFCETETHALGYFVDYTDQEFCLKLEELRKQRIKRIYVIAEKLDKVGVKIEVDEVFDTSGIVAPGRLNVAELLRRKGYVDNIFQAFKEYLGPDCPAFVPKELMSLSDAVKLINSTGGIAVIAHPHKIKGEVSIPEMIEDGIQGIEAYYPYQKPSIRTRYKKLAKTHNLVITGGSDYHGAIRPDIKLGDIGMPTELVEKLFEQNKKNKGAN